MLAIIQNARAQALSDPRIDMPNAYEAPGGIVEGRSRQITPLPVPEYEVPFEAKAAPNGVVKLNWERSARMIGLVFELRRFGGLNDSESGTLLTRTERFDFVDAAPPVGKIRYELTPISEPSLTCGAYWVSEENRANEAFAAVRGTPVSRNVEIIEASAPNGPTDVQARQSSNGLC